MDLEMNVHILWILTWAATLCYQDDDEKPFRLKQVVEVIRRINAKDNKLNVRLRNTHFHSLRYSNFSSTRATSTARSRWSLRSMNS